METKRTYEKVQRREKIVWAVIYSASWIIFIVGMVDFFHFVSDEETMVAAGFMKMLPRLASFFVAFFVCIYVLCKLDFDEKRKYRFVKKASFLLSLVDLALRVIASLCRATVQAVWFSTGYIKEEAVGCLNSNLDRLIEEETIRRDGR